MLEYTLDDAEGLLTKNFSAAENSLESVDKDLGFIRDQTTTIEVSILLQKSSLELNIVYAGMNHCGFSCMLLKWLLTCQLKVCS